MSRTAPSPKLLTLEIEFLNRKLKKSGLRQEILQQIHINLVQKHELFRIATGEVYQRIYDVNQLEKERLCQMFISFNGFSWNHQFGWVGQPKTLSREEIPTFAAEVILFDGIECFNPSSEFNLSSTSISNKTAHAARKLSSTSPSNAPDSLPILKIFGINFTAYGCYGELTSQMATFDSCQHLNLDFNCIYGELPSDLSRLTNLEYLTLSSNLLSGEIHHKLLNSLVKLRRLDFSFNSFEGTIPDSFENTKRLNECNFSGNRFQGMLPSSFSNLSNLKSLKLYSNLISGSIPEGYKNLTNMTELNLSSNRLDGYIDPIYDCVKLRKLILNNNQFQGPISSNISKLSAITLIYLHNNEFSGLLPSELGALTQLRHLNLSNNHLEGVLPHEITRLTELEVLLLHENQFIGPIPKDFAKNLSHLKDFQLFRNCFADSNEPLAIPRDFRRSYFERIYNWGPSVGIDNIYWTTDETHPQPSGHATEAFEHIHQINHQF